MPLSKPKEQLSV